MSIIGPILGVLGLGGIGAALVFIPGALAAVGNLAAAAFNFLGKVNWAKIWWIFPISATALVVVIQGHKLANRDDIIAARDKTIVADAKALETTKTSLDGALTQIADNNKRVEAAHAALLAAEKDAAAANARSDARYVATKGAVARLEASATTKGQPPCEVSPEALKALGGL